MCASLFRTDAVCRFTSVILTLVQINTIYSIIDKNNLSAVLFSCVWLQIPLISCQIRRIFPDFAPALVETFDQSWCFQSNSPQSRLIVCRHVLPYPRQLSSLSGAQVSQGPDKRADKAESMPLFCNLKQISQRLSISLTVVSRYAYTFVILFSLDFLVNQPT